MPMSFGDNPSVAGNQQGRSILSPDALAGLIVGEGSYCIGIVRPKTGYLSLRPIFSLRMNDVETIDLVQASFFHYGIDLYRNPAIYHRCHTVTTSGGPRMRKHLDFFLPLLFGKKLEAASVLSEFVDRRLAAGHREYDETDVQFVERMREVNGSSGMRLPIETLRDYMRKPSARNGKNPLPVGKI